jgi:hypothetical protein
LDKDQKYTIGYSFKNKMGISANNFVILELIKDGSIMYTRKLQATEATTFDYTAPATGEYTWRMRSSSIGTTTTQPITYWLDNLSIFYTYPYTLENCDNLADGYRFGLNGKEKESDIYGESNAYDFGARIHDARIGRWLSVDLLERMYPMYSSYSSSLNNPILLKDVNGKWVTDKDGNLIVTMESKTSDFTIGGYENGTYTVTGNYGKALSNNGQEVRIFVPNSATVIYRTYDANRKVLSEKDITATTSGDKNCTTEGLMPNVPNIIISSDDITPYILKAEGYTEANSDVSTCKGDIVVYSDKDKSGKTYYSHYERFVNDSKVNTKGGVQKGPIIADPGKKTKFGTPKVWTNNNASGETTNISMPYSGEASDGKLDVGEETFNEIKEGFK